MRHDPEEIILAGVLYDQDRVKQAAVRLSPEQFLSDRNRLIFMAMLIVYENQIEVNLVTIKQALGQIGYQGRPAIQYVGESYLNLLIIGVPPFKETFDSALLDLLARPKKPVDPEKEIDEEEWPDTIGGEDEPQS